MRLQVDHRTVYRFAEPQGRLVQLLRVTPQNTHDQTVVRWDILVDRDVRLRQGTDGFGNATTMLYAEGPVDAIEITVVGEVLTSHSDGVVHGTAEPLPPALFLRATPMTPPDEDIAAFAREQGGADRLDALHRINRALSGRCAGDLGRPEPGLDAASAFARDKVGPRDLAHVFTVAARSIGAPARYVSGYSLVDGAHAPTPHCWVEAHVDRLGWVAFDPCRGMCPQEEYVRVAVALDAAGAAPVAGSRLGEGAEELDVDVSVSEA